MNIIIIGFKGCGKTLIGKILAGRLEKKFYDIDSIIESIYTEETKDHLPFREIYKKHGREYFRGLEKRVLDRMQKFKNCIISLGGGTLFVEDDVYKRLVDNIVIYLHVESDILYERIIKNGIPAFFDSADPRKSFDKLYAERLPTYRRLADIIVDNSKEVENTVNIILEELSKKS
jgi:shikimate kinase